MNERKRVLLIDMPFGSTKYAAVGISLLKSRLEEEGIPCDIRYFSIHFADLIGFDRYEAICAGHSQNLLIGDWLFAEAVFGDQLPSEEHYRAYLKTTPYCENGDIGMLEDTLALRTHVGGFLDSCLQSIPWTEYEVVGFSTRFEQNLASFALAQRIKAQVPALTIVFGGSNCDGEMGVQMHASLPCIDYVCVGEAELSFPQLVRDIIEGKDPIQIPGVVCRKNGTSTMIDGTQMIQDLNALPFPNYDDYYEQIAPYADSSPAAMDSHFDVFSGLPMETARGCWWGAVHHCTFCGLNDDTLGFRSKRAERVLNEIRYLTKRYHESHITMMDNILENGYFKDLIPALRHHHPPVTIFYEVKANMSKDQVRMLAEANILYVQPGIESLNSHILALMDKGITGLQNIQFLKYLKEYGIYPNWAILTHFPGETEEDYRHMLSQMEKITHLPPPGTAFPISLHRFSPYFNSPHQYGLVNVRPMEAYRFLYPFDESDLRKLVYYFDFDYTDAMRPPRGFSDRLLDVINRWCDSYDNQASLDMIPISSNSILIEDHRPHAVNATTLLRSIEKDIYEYCDRIHSLASILSFIRRRHSQYAFRERDIREFLDDMVAQDLMLQEEDKYLSLAIAPSTTTNSVSREESWPTTSYRPLDNRIGVAHE